MRIWSWGNFPFSERAVTNDIGRIAAVPLGRLRGRVISRRGKEPCGPWAEAGLSGRAFQIFDRGLHGCIPHVAAWVSHTDQRGIPYVQEQPVL